MRLTIFCLVSYKLVLVCANVNDFVKMKLEAFPYVAGIYKENVLIAGSTILSEQFVLCMQNIRADNLKFHVKAGSLYIDGKGDLIPVLKFYEHADFDPITLKNGITLVQLESFITLGPTARPALLPVADYEWLRAYVIAGWGQQQPDKHFRIGLVKIINNKENSCKDLIEKDNNIVCVESPKHLFDFMDICTPLLDEDGRVHAVGVKKSGDGSAFMLVKPFTNWLLKEMEENVRTTPPRPSTTIDPNPVPTSSLDPTTDLKPSPTDIVVTTEDDSDQREGSAQILQPFIQFYSALIVFSFLCF